MKKHESYFDKKGNELPSVTTVLKILNKPELIKWANNIGFRHKKIEDILEETATVGSIVHEMIENYEGFYSLKDYCKLPLKNKIEVDKAFASYEEWRKDYEPKKIKNEMKINNGLFGGTIDCYCKIDGYKYIIDYKTSSNVYPTMFLQLAAYAILLEHKGKKVNKVGILQLSKKGKKYKFVECDIKDLKKYKELFLYLYQAYLIWTGILKNDWESEF